MPRKNKNAVDVRRMSPIERANYFEQRRSGTDFRDLTKELYQEKQAESDE